MNTCLLVAVIYLLIGLLVSLAAFGRSELRRWTWRDWRRGLLGWPVTVVCVVILLVWGPRR